MTTVRPTLKLPTIPINLRQYGILAAFAVIVVLFQVLTDGRLLLPGNINNLIQQNAYVLSEPRISLRCNKHTSELFLSLKN